MCVCTQSRKWIYETTYLQYHLAQKIFAPQLPHHPHDAFSHTHANAKRLSWSWRMGVRADEWCISGCRRGNFSLQWWTKGHITAVNQDNTRAQAHGIPLFYLSSRSLVLSLFIFLLHCIFFLIACKVPLTFSHLISLLFFISLNYPLSSSPLTISSSLFPLSISPISLFISLRQYILLLYPSLFSSLFHSLEFSSNLFSPLILSVFIIITTFPLSSFLYCL